MKSAPESCFTHFSNPFTVLLQTQETYHACNPEGLFSSYIIGVTGLLDEALDMA